MENDLIDKLKSLGFKEYESRVFLVLLKGSQLSASEIAKEANIIRNSIYDILKSFVDRGYCNEIETNSILKYELIDPDVILDKLKRNFDRKRDEEDNILKDTFTKLRPLYKTNMISGKDRLHVELIRGYNQHREAKFVELLKNAKREILFMIRLEHFVSDELDLNAKKFFRRGGVIRSVYQAGKEIKVKKNLKVVDGTIDDLIRIVEKYEKYGEHVKLSEEPVPNMTIFDNEIVYMNINDKTLPRHQEADLVIRNKDFAKNMKFIFETYWNQSVTIKEFSKLKNHI